VNTFPFVVFNHPKLIEAAANPMRTFAIPTYYVMNGSKLAVTGGLNMSPKYNPRQTSDVAMLDLNGRLSLGEALAFGPGSGVVLSETIHELTKKGQKKILLNLAEVTYVDSSGVGQLVGALTTARSQGSDIKLLKPTLQVLDLLKITKMDSVFDIHEDETAAIQSFSKGAAATA
jgi:anti-sigma B factor antagonist